MKCGDDGLIWIMAGAIPGFPSHSTMLFTTRCLGDRAVAYVRRVNTTGENPFAT
jgi:hypothetical protein